MNQVENQYKIIVVGDTGTGKSSLIVKFTDNAFTNAFNSTIGVDFRTKAFDVDDKRVRLYIWDTAGQERFRAITRSYYNTTEGIILSFDISNKETFITLPLWMEDFERYGKTNCPIILVGTKSDRLYERQVSTKDALAFVDSYIPKFNIQYIETSSKNGKNVDGVFEQMGRALLKIKSIIPKTEAIIIEKPTTTRAMVKQDTCCTVI
jgi:Ras-related protein Rab-1A